MGAGSSCPNGCLGLDTSSVAIFPSVSVISEYAQLEVNLQKQYETVTKVVAVPAKAIPYAGPVLSSILPVLVTLSFSGVNSALTKAQIQEQITDNEMKNIGAELKVIKNKLEWVQTQTGDNMKNSVTEHELLYAYSRLETIFEKFRDEKHILRKYPLVSLPQFAQVTGVLWSTSQLISALYPTKKEYTKRLVDNMKMTIQQVSDDFLKERTKDIKAKMCSTQWKYRSQCVIQDSPWEGGPFRGELTRTTTKMGQQARCRSVVDNLPCHDGIESNGSFTWGTARPYTTSLKREYKAKFERIFPIPPVISL